jgi:PBSX family phage portal protein
MNDVMTIDASSTAAEPMLFSFGEPDSVIGPRDLWTYFEIWNNGRWYETPLPMVILGKSFNMAAHHRSAIGLKVNLLVEHFVPTRYLDSDNFERFALDFLQMGNGYLEEIDNLAGRPLGFRHSLAAWTRMGVEPGTAFFVQGPIGVEHEFRKDKLHQLQQPDVLQEIYGVPEWLAALQDGLLNENATLFRRRYYLNGAHAGFVFYLNEPLADQETKDKLTEQLKNAKGRGNFKNLFLHIPGGKKDGVQIVPLSEVAAKDEFQNIKNISRDSLLSAHRTPPQLLGIIPQNNGGFGDVGRAMDVFFPNEIQPIASRFTRMNERLGVEAFKFRAYEPKGNGAAAG